MAGMEGDEWGWGAGSGSCGLDLLLKILSLSSRLHFGIVLGVFDGSWGLLGLDSLQIATMVLN